MELHEASNVRVDAWAKVSGSARFVDDLSVPGAWFGGTVRSPVARGRIRKIELDRSFDSPRVTIVTARDLPGPNAVAMIRDDHPILAADRVAFVAEPLALIAAPDRETLAAALAAVKVEIEEEPPVLTIEEALEGKAILWGDDNILAEYRIQTGEAASAMKRADRVIEGTYRTGHQEHLYLEPNGMIAIPREDGGIEVVGSLQCPFYVHRALVHALGIDAGSVVVRQATTGGAFGGKEDFPSILALHAALLALRSRHPVRMIYERSEDLRATTKRHPSRIHHRTGVSHDGTLVAAEIDLVLDGGAATTLSPVVLSRSILHATGAYRIPNVSIRGRVVATNHPPSGAFRGFGAPQSLFAMERQIDRIAAALSIEPLELRRKNLLRDGDRLPCGQRLKEGVGAELVLERAVALSSYIEKRAAYARAGGGALRRGIGLSLYLHGGGFTGAGEERIAGKVIVRFVESGRVEILTSNVEMGQGASTILCMIAARALGLRLERIRHVDPDTSVVPDTGPTVASRTTMIVGRIVIDACNDMLAKLVSPGRAGRSSGKAVPAGDAFLDAALRHLRDAGPLSGEAVYSPPSDLRWDEEAYRGDAYKAYSWGADVVEVEVDAETLEVRPVKASVVVEIGRAVHPVLAIGQVTGGTLQAIGFGSLEEIKLSAGRLLNDRMATCIIPTSLDAPETEVEIAEIPSAEGSSPRGPYGAKGLGELPADGGAPALVSAIDQATGLFLCEIPVTPERLLGKSDADRSDG